jgi:hypothetical protein
MFSQWSRKPQKLEQNKIRKPQNEDYKEICSGLDKKCNLLFDSRTDSYKTESKCCRGTFCTELRILKHQAEIRLKTTHTKFTLIKEYTTLRDI